MGVPCATNQGLTLVHFSARDKHCLGDTLVGDSDQVRPETEHESSHARSAHSLWKGALELVRRGMIPCHARSIVVGEGLASWTFWNQLTMR
jgi:hypothetical protein